MMVVNAPVVCVPLLVIFLSLSAAGIEILPLAPDQLKRNPAYLLLLAAVPMLMILFATWQDPAVVRGHVGLRWQDAVLWALLAVQVLVGAWLVRRLKYRGLTLTIGIVALFTTAGTLFVVAMEMHDDWL